jgi:hypothetical protein
MVNKKRDKVPLSITHPELAKEADGWDPTKVTFGSDKKLSWRCMEGHEWLASPNSRTSKKITGCPICSGNKLLVGFNDLATTHPQLSNQAFGWDPKSVSRGSRKRVGWKCREGHYWEAIIANRTSLGYGCPICSGQTVLTGFNDLETTDPEIASQAFGWDPKKISRGSKKKLKWMCVKGHTWVAPPKNRTGNGSGCSVCLNQTIQVGINDIATTHPDIAKELFSSNGQSITAGSSRIVAWQCSQGHKYKTSPQKRINRENGCPYCSGHRVLAGFNDLATTHPELSLQASGWDPKTVTRGSEKKCEWKCPLGHKWKAAVYSRALGGVNCPICAGFQVLEGFNDLATTHPILAREAFGWDPRKLSRGSNKKVKWLCEKGHQWKSAVNSRALGVGCPSCAIYGFDPNKEGWIYFLSHENWEMLQIGISNAPEQRLKKHKKLGWELIELRGPMDGLIAREWETSMLEMLRRHGAMLGPEQVAGKFDGYTESWIKASFPVKNLKELMNLVKDNE